MRADHLDFVVGAYAAATLVIGYLVASVTIEGRRLKRALDALKPGPRA